MNQHINVFNQIVSNLKQVDMNFDDEDIMLMLLNSLPTSLMYENLVTIQMWGKETLILEEITSALLSFNPRKKASDENSQGEGLVVRSNQEHGEASLETN